MIWLLLLACRPSACDWEAERDRALCEVIVTCGFGEVTAVPDCLDSIAADPDAAPTCDPSCGPDGVDEDDRACPTATAPDVRCPSYDPGAGRRCVAALERQAAACPSSRDAWVLPAACGATCAP